MKLRMFFAGLISAFLTCALAAPASTDELNGGPIVAFDKAVSDGRLNDIWTGADPHLGPNAIVGNVDYPNGTVPDDLDSLEEDQGGDNTQNPILRERDLVITMGTQRQHVGYTVSRNLANELRRALRNACTNGWARLPGPMCRRDVQYINDIEYNRGHNAWLEVKVHSDYIPSLGNDDEVDEYKLRDLFIDTIVNVFAASINTHANRYQIRMIPCREFANSADWYQVGIYGGPTFPHMRVIIKFNGVTDEGRFDCKGSQAMAWDSLKWYNRDFMREYDGLLHRRLRYAIACSPEEGRPTGDCNNVRCDLASFCQNK